MRFLALFLLAGCFAAEAAPEPRRPKRPKVDACHAALDEMQVRYRVANPHAGIERPVEILGPLGGVTYRAWVKGKPLVLDCSLAQALAQAGPFFTAQGLVEGTYSGAYVRRNIRGTAKPSSHGFGLALDVHRWRTESGIWLSVDPQFEIGLGDEVDCIGLPTTEEARVLRTVWCQLERSGLFRFVLGPDEDADHRNHFHIEALPWAERDLAARPGESPDRSGR